MVKVTARLVCLLLVCSALLFASAGASKPYVGTPEQELQYNERLARFEIPKGFKFANPKAKMVKDAFKYWKDNPTFPKLKNVMQVCHAAVRVEEDQNIFWLKLGKKRKCHEGFAITVTVVAPLEDDMYFGHNGDYETTGKLDQEMDL
mmetsp:Transcript_38322/g.82399  ORF Transcript_38322/g.82399 Transcript_38322/m.82399 type:complete len:147 (+) Transcript_38322:126-566(+)